MSAFPLFLAKHFGRSESHTDQLSINGNSVSRAIIHSSKSLINEIEKAIYFCQKLGVDTHMKNIKCDRLFYKEHLYGIALFVKMIDTDKGNRYLSELDKINWIY